MEIPAQIILIGYTLVTATVFVIAAGLYTFQCP